jgi:hypothetical protein
MLRCLYPFPKTQHDLITNYSQNPFQKAQRDLAYQLFNGSLKKHNMTWHINYSTVDEMRVRHIKRTRSLYLA